MMKTGSMLKKKNNVCLILVILNTLVRQAQCIPIECNARLQIILRCPGYSIIIHVSTE